MFVLGDLRDICPGLFWLRFGLFGSSALGNHRLSAAHTTFCAPHTDTDTHTHTHTQTQTDAHPRADTCFAVAPWRMVYIYWVTAASAWLRPLSFFFLGFKATFLIFSSEGSEISVARLVPEGVVGNLATPVGGASGRPTGRGWLRHVGISGPLLIRQKKR